MSPPPGHSLRCISFLLNVLCGSSSPRPPQFIILVVDSTDRERLAISKEELYRMLAHEVRSFRLFIRPREEVEHKEPALVFLVATDSLHGSPSALGCTDPGLIVLLLGLPSGPAEGSCVDICQQAGYEELHDCSGDLQLPHPELHQRSPVAHTVLLRSHGRGVRGRGPPSGCRCFNSVSLNFF